MTATTVDETAAAAGTPGVGRVARVIGPVVDIEFPADQIPEIYNALTVDIDLSGQGEGEGEGTLRMTLEVAQHLGDSLVRAIALKPTDGLVRGAQVRSRRPCHRRGRGHRVPRGPAPRDVQRAPGRHRPVRAG